MKSKTTALILSIFLGGCGVDRFYLGYTGMGVLKLLTGGCLGILSLIDIIQIATGNLRPADGSPYIEMAQSPTQYQPNIQAQPTSTPYDNLEKISALHKAGALTDEEFAKMKSELLAKM
ncbi:MAG: NINE protein [Ruminococcaceae bacterium]|nr:NINE protein [Oscillospiraceae bacterium]